MKTKINTVLFLLLLGTSALFGAVYHVAPPAAGGDDNNSGSDWGSPKATIANVLAQTDVTEILVSNGTYVLTSEIVLNKAVAIRSWNDGATDPEGTVLDGNNETRCLNITHPDAVVEGLTVTQGFLSGNSVRGGGIYMTAGIVTNCNIVSNEVAAYNEGYGGSGICLNGGGALWNCRIADNLVTNNSTLHRAGGGVLVVSAGSIMNCQIYNNQTYAQASWGGGGVMFYNGGYMENCILSNNYASSGAGAFVCYRSAVITNCQFVGNTSYNNGGGIGVLRGNEVLLTDLMVSNNIAGNPDGTGTGSGGGISISSSTNMVLRNLQVLDNLAGRDAGGVYASALDNFLLEDSLIARNECQGKNSGGGGIYVAGAEDEVAKIRRLEIRDNVSSSTASWGGGGAHIKNVLLEDCRITGNIAGNGARGGGISAMLSTIINCQISSNNAEGIGGGADLKEPSVMRNCLVSNNKALNRYGGGIYLAGKSEASACTVINNDLAGTAAQQRGAGLYVVGNNYVVNCIVVSNTWTGTTDGERDIGLYSSDLEASANSVHYSCSSHDFNGERGNITDQPAFVDFNNGNYRLAAGSAGINAGTNETWMSEPDARDLDGHPRLDRFSKLADMGCYEYLPQGVLFRVK